MKTLIIYISIHQGNTEKIAKAMAGILNAKLINPDEVKIDELSQYDLIGFGSGIYFQKHHKSLLNLVDKLPKLQNKNAFIFSTRGMGPVRFYHRLLRNKLLKKGFNIAGEFSCKGFDTFGPFKIIGGINKGRPGKKDLENAKDFARDIISKKMNKKE
ncbi:MAG: flavodoxin family protein [Nanoarchaeota archaeon]|nr:flavodoxin family protein [Nanoarchaeota archaeon]